MNPDEILATIKEIYSKRKESFPIGLLWSKLRPNSKSEKDKIRFAVVYLKNKGLIDYNLETGYMNPIFTEEEMPYTKPKQLWMDDVKVKMSIKSFFKEKSVFPSSTEIVSKFIQLFGVPANDDPDRFVRDMFEKGKLKKDAIGKYYFDGIESSNLGLRVFI